MLAVGFAPFWLGGARPEPQAVLGVLLGLGLLLLWRELGEPRHALEPKWLKWLLALVVLLPLLPLPGAIIQLITPERARLAAAFPTEAGGVTGVLPLVLSLDRAIQRVWEIALMLAVFTAARAGSRQPFVWQAYPLVLAAAVIFQGAADIYFRATGSTHLLGIWEVSWGKSAGTFVNRNHFANWVFVATLLLSGLLLKYFAPLRGSRLHSGAPPEPARLPAMLLASLAILFGMAVAFGSGSRGGALAFGAGAVVFMILLRIRSQSRTRMMLVGVAAALLVVVLVVSGGFLMERLENLGLDIVGRYPKVAIWKQSLLLALKFPLFGVGAGNFVTAFNFYKPFAGDQTVFHAENDYVQSVLEFGWFGALLLLAAGCVAARQLLAFLRFGRMAEPELTLGAAAAVLAFAVHATGEFVGQITSTSLLAASMLGLIAGQRDLWRETREPAGPPSFRGWKVAVAGFLLIALGSFQLASVLAFRRALALPPGLAQKTAAVSSLSFWPFTPGRKVAIARAVTSTPTEQSAERARNLQTAREILVSGIRWNPLEWDLRLERALLDSVAEMPPARLRDEVKTAVALNPLQPRMAFLFASQLLTSDPDFALNLLRKAKTKRPEELEEALKLAWQIRRDTSVLWELTPDSPEGLTILAEFGLSKGLKGLSIQAAELLEAREERARVAELYLKLGQPEKVLRLFDETNSRGEQHLILARALLKLELYPRCLNAAEASWRSSAAGIKLAAPPAKVDPKPPIESGGTNAVTASLARAQAEWYFGRPAADRDWIELSKLAVQFPSDPRILYIRYQTALDRLDFRSAAFIGVDLAELLHRR